MHRLNIIKAARLFEICSKPRTFNVMVESIAEILPRNKQMDRRGYIYMEHMVT